MNAWIRGGGVPIAGSTVTGAFTPVVTPRPSLTDTVTAYSPALEGTQGKSGVFDPMHPAGRFEYE